MTTKPYIDLNKTIKETGMKKFEIMFYGADKTRATHVYASTPEDAVKQAAKTLFGPRAFFTTREPLDLAYEHGAIGQIVVNDVDLRQTTPLTDCSLFIAELLPTA